MSPRWGDPTNSQIPENLYVTNPFQEGLPFLPFEED